jgi:hypothetical protein
MPYSAVYRLIGGALHFQGQYDEAAHEKSYIAALEGNDVWNMAQSLSWQADGLAGLLAGLLRGELAWLQHYFLRFLLWRSGFIPWHYPSFPDEAADRVLLRKVGVGYSSNEAIQLRMIRKEQLLSDPMLIFDFRVILLWFPVCILSRAVLLSIPNASIASKLFYQHQALGADH